MKIYVASSWRNEHQPRVVEQLRAAGFEVYDFRNPEEGDHGFGWSWIDPDWQRWTVEQFRAALSHPLADHGFGLDMNAMEWADAFVLLQPCGRSAHLEAGWAAGRGKPVIVALVEGQEPELMLKMCSDLVRLDDESRGIIAALQRHEGHGCRD